MMKRIAILVIGYGAVVAALSFGEAGLWQKLMVADLEKFRATDLHHVFRQAGNVVMWILIALAIGLTQWKQRGAKLTAWMIVVSPLMAGAMAELLKRVIGRERPGTIDPTGAYTFKPFLGAFSDGSNLGIPSSHAAVAFGGAFILLRLFPCAGWVALVWAIGCGVTRIALGAHYVSDVVAGAALGHIAATILMPPEKAERR